MSRYYFEESIAPISHAVRLMRFPVETAVREFSNWAAGYDSVYTRRSKVACNVYVEEVSAHRHELPGLIKPQNVITQFVFVPTNSEWTAVFGPCSFFKAAKLPRIGDFAFDLACERQITPRMPYFISLEHEPRVDTADLAYLHTRSYGSLGFTMYALPSGPVDGMTACYFERRLEAYRHESMTLIQDQTEPFLDYGFDFGSLPEVTEFPEETFTDEQADVMWSQFGEQQVEEILAPLGVNPYDDAFYGSKGYLVRLTPAQVVDEHSRQLVAAPDYDPPERIPIEKFQMFRGLHDGPIRSWSSEPIR